MLIPNFEHLRQIAIRLNGNFSRLIGKHNQDTRVAILQFITGRRYAKKDAGINELKKQLQIYCQAPDDQCQAVIDEHVYKAILEYKVSSVMMKKIQNEALDKCVAETYKSIINEKTS